MRIVVDLNRCQSYGQCVYAAPTVFRFHGEFQEAGLEYDYTPSDKLRDQVKWAAAACPVQAIRLEDGDTPTGRDARPEQDGGES